MSQDSIIDYLACILFRVISPALRSLPPSAALFIGRRLGELFYVFDLKHRFIAYANLRVAFADKFSSCRLTKITKDFYRAYGQNIIEIFLIPKVDKGYIQRYVNIDGLGNVREAFKLGKGVILLGVHAGSWELSNIICANLGFPFSLFVRTQKLPRLNTLLNFYRTQKGCRLIQSKNQTRQLIQELRANNSMGMTLDQGGRDGILVDFLGKPASMSTGAVRIALRYDACLVPAFYRRVSGPKIQVVVEPALQLKRSGDLEKDLRDNLQELARIYEKHILKYPQEYLWTYKIWKYSNQRNILILSDGKAGHLRQSEAAAGLVSNYFKDKGISANIQAQEVVFKSKFARSALAFCWLISSRLSCQGCLFCLRRFLREDIYQALVKVKPDVIISTGSALALVNLIFARETLAKSIALMRPPLFATRRFDLVIMPWHDKPPKKKNVVVTEGALNIIDEDYLREQDSKLTQVSGVRCQVSGLIIGLLIGGDAKGFKLGVTLIKNAIAGIKKVSEKIGAQILVTTSRRTSFEVERLVKEEFKGYPRCKLLVVVNEKNVPEAMGGILSSSDVIVATPESISMISEAVSSRKLVLVMDIPGLDKKHRRFLDHFSDKGYIYLTKRQDLGRSIEELLERKPPVKAPDDNAAVLEAIRKML